MDAINIANTDKMIVSIKQMFLVFSLQNQYILKLLKVPSSFRITFYLHLYNVSGSENARWHPLS